MRDDEHSIFWCMLMLDDLWRLLAVFAFVSFQLVNQCSRWHRGFTCRTTPRQSRSSCLYEPWILIICLSWLGIYIESTQILYKHTYIMYWYTSRNSPLSHLQFHIYTFDACQAPWTPLLLQVMQPSSASPESWRREAKPKRCRSWAISHFNIFWDSKACQRLFFSPAI